MNTLTHKAAILSALEKETPSFFSTYQTPFADLLQRLTTLVPNAPLPSFTVYEQGELLHLLDTCDNSAPAIERSLPLDQLAQLPLTAWESNGICNYCASFIIGSTKTRKAYYYGSQQEMGSSARQLRTLYFASHYLTLALQSQTSINPRAGLLTRATITMSSLRARSSILGWRNQLIQQVNSQYDSDTCQELLTKLDLELSKTDYTPSLPAGGAAVGSALLAGIKQPSTSITEHLVIDKHKFRKVHTSKILNGVKREASTPLDYEDFKKLLSASPKHPSNSVNAYHSSLDATLPENTWTLVYLPHIPEVPLAAAYLKHFILRQGSNKEEPNFQLSGFAVLPTPLAIALTYCPRRFPKVEFGKVADSTSNNSERVHYDSGLETIIPLQVLAFDQIQEAIDAQTLNLTLELWDSTAEGNGLTIGSYPWALLGAESYQLARTLR